jgi:hypothetical protein
VFALPAPTTTSSFHADPVAKYAFRAALAETLSTAHETIPVAVVPRLYVSPEDIAIGDVRNSTGTGADTGISSSSWWQRQTSNVQQWWFAASDGSTGGWNSNVDMSDYGGSVLAAATINTGTRFYTDTLASFEAERAKVAAVNALV